MITFKAEYINASDLATILNTTRQNICRLINEKKIKAIKIGSSWRIPVEEVERIQKEGV